MTLFLITAGVVLIGLLAWALVHGGNDHVTDDGQRVASIWELSSLTGLAPETVRRRLEAAGVQPIQYTEGHHRLLVALYPRIKAQEALDR